MSVNLIIICLDSFRQDHVGFYHAGKPVFDEVPACRTPNIDAFARDCIVFDNMYPSGLPTLLVRTEVMTGNFTLPFRGWQPLVTTDLTIAEVLRREGYVNGFISDMYFYPAPGMNYHRGFHSYRWIRGQADEPYASHPTRRRVDDYVNAHYTERQRNAVARFLANTDDFTEEEHWFPAQVFSQACEWLKRNRVHRKKFCWIESLDPHEPWDPPERFDTYTDPDYKGPRLIQPLGGPVSEWATPEEQKFIRGLYAGEASFVDYCLKQLFDCLKNEGYFDDSVIVLFADHGHPLADHDRFLKGPERVHSELIKVPFMIRLPGAKHRRTEALAQYPDVLPTLFDLLGMAGNKGAVSGRSFASVVRGESDRHRDAIIVGYHEAADRCIRDNRWSYIARPVGRSDELYDLKNDPRERTNLIDRYPDEAQRLARQFGNYWRQEYRTEIRGTKQ